MCIFCFSWNENRIIIIFDNLCPSIIVSYNVLKFAVKLWCNHPTFITTGVLLTAVCLINEMCEKSPDTLHHFRKVTN